MKEFGEKLRELRQSKDLSQKLGESLLTPGATIKHGETRGHGDRFVTLGKIAKFFG